MGEFSNNPATESDQRDLSFIQPPQQPYFLHEGSLINAQVDDALEIVRKTYAKSINNRQEN